jgi:DUF971 family protein
MKKSALLLVLSACLGLVNSAFAQVVTSAPVDYNDPTAEVKIIVNLAQLDQTKEYVLNLIADAQSDSGIYIWTWKPFERSPLAKQQRIAAHDQGKRFGV